MVCRSYKKCKKVHYFSHSIRSFSIRHNVFIRSGVKGDIRNVCFVPCCGRHFKFGYASSASSEEIKVYISRCSIFYLIMLTIGSTFTATRLDWCFFMYAGLLKWNSTWMTELDSNYITDGIVGLPTSRAVWGTRLRGWNLISMRCSQRVVEVVCVWQKQSEYHCVGHHHDCDVKSI